MSFDPTCPDGLTDLVAVTEVLQQWPRDEAFCVEILFVTQPGGYRSSTLSRLGRPVVIQD